jgi:hypothetical protein
MHDLREERIGLRCEEWLADLDLKYTVGSLVLAVLRGYRRWRTRLTGRP